MATGTGAVSTRLVANGAAGSARLQQAALDLAQAMPRLALEARQVASTAMHGLHGRRRAGQGENFWQFRHFVSGEAADSVDWRRSARGDSLYVREHEWDAAHTLWLWVDRSPSMALVSSLAQASKIERALVLCFALAELLVRGGERVGLIGLVRPSAQRAIVEKLALALLASEPAATGLPERQALSPRSEAVLIGDFLGDPGELAATLAAVSSRHARGHLLMIADPVEETFPFAGRAELIDPENGTKFLAGRAQDLKAAYESRLAGHREAVRDAARRHGWSVTLHRTDRPASQAILALHPLLRQDARA
ncbi:DUF58 domain-containing protein [Labrys monachus]|uniref:Uncharacterized protein (DUF58 family) n=1 Tax=Labrys monachus TaxID=217067 RepID=A0ABU0FKT5_9HYPH|nr:DUF58 domain-containing protein [Labrys monachus]MDQ0394698.1 uncharacterized protein (DUF58 family) [Labrys monachus]